MAAVRGYMFYKCGLFEEARCSLVKAETLLCESANPVRHAEVMKLLALTAYALKQNEEAAYWLSLARSQLFTCRLYTFRADRGIMCFHGNAHIGGSTRVPVTAGLAGCPAAVDQDGLAGDQRGGGGCQEHHDACYFDGFADAVQGGDPLDDVRAEPGIRQRGLGAGRADERGRDRDGRSGCRPGATSWSARRCASCWRRTTSRGSPVPRPGSLSMAVVRLARVCDSRAAR